MMNVDWSSYAEVYDLMTANNPAYQNILARFKAEIDKWELPPQSTLCDLGAGTGNFSLVLSSSFPHCHVMHVDADERMNEAAQHKASKEKVRNIGFVAENMEETSFEPQSLSAIISVHALYSLRHPQALINRMHEWLKPGGYLFVCDLGRTLNVRDWASYLFMEAAHKYGLIGALGLFYRGRAIAKHNRHISKNQRAGVYWTHDPQAFRNVFEQAGFEIIACEEAYRGYSDIVVCRKVIAENS